MTRVMETSQTRGMTRLILLLIANHETEERGAFPAVDRLAREAGCSVRTVQECVGRAKAMGELEVHLRAGPHGTNVYRTLSGLKAAAPLPGMETTGSRTPQNLHPADTRRESAPELKELGVTDSVKGSSSSHLLLAAPPARKGQDPLFEAVAESCGLDWRTDLTPTARGALNKAVAEIRSVGASPDDVRIRSTNYQSHFPDAVLTPSALAKHWPALAKPKAPDDRRHAEILALMEAGS